VALTRLGSLVGLAAVVSGCGSPGPDDGQLAAADRSEASFPVPSIEWNPRTYEAQRAPSPLLIDGRLDDDAWAIAARSADFVDIEGPHRPSPFLSTTMRILWDDDFVYFAAEMEEPHLWATLTERDAVIYLDNDFEVFIDPDGDTHEYYELEINALGTEWDLFLVRPYRDGGPALHAWDIPGLRTAVSLGGTLNDPSDSDAGWTVEIAIPWTVLREAAHRPSPPESGDVWRVNFSRVQWLLDETENGYEKRRDEDGESLPEFNWVWSPQGLIAMHYPEMWGFVRFVDHDGAEAFGIPRSDSVKWALREVYYGQRELFDREGRFTDRLEALKPGLDWPNGIPVPELSASPAGFDAVVLLEDGSRLVIATDGRIRHLPR